MDNRYQKPAILITVMMACFGVFAVHGISISSVAVNTEAVPLSSTKSLSMINIPQVPEFPKLAARPGKSPTVVGGSAPPPTATTNQINSQQQQQQQQPQPQQQSYNQQQQYQPQQSYHSSQQVYPHPVQNLISSFGLPSLPADSEQFDDSDDDSRGEQEDYASENDGYNESSHSEQVVTTTFHTFEPVLTTLNGTSTNKLATVQPEKNQESPGDFPMPAHVLNILNALGTGGSLAQATKPEKDGVGQGYTTANAIGYATGDNATVTASVSNKMELNTQTVILTESASASASSMSNGTAFSQATLASNGYTSQYGPAAGGTGWKTSSKNPPLFM